MVNHISIGKLAEVNHIFLGTLYMVNHFQNWYTRDKKGGCAMPPSEAQKKAANKYNLQHMSTVGCKVTKEQAAAFKAYSSALGKTSNAILKEFVLSCIESAERS